MKKRNIAITAGITSSVVYLAALKHYYEFCFKRDQEQDQPLPKNSKSYLINREGMKYISEIGYEEIHIVSRDGLQLTGYYFDQNSDQTIILVHGYRSTGFNEYASYMQFLTKANYNILIIDQRSHGKSEGKWICFGYQEKYDLLDWTSYLYSHYSYQDLFYLGVSMGSATVMLTSNEDLSKYKVRGIIADCGYDTLSNEVKAVMKRMKVPSWLFYKPSNLIHKIHFGYSIEEVNPIESIKQTKLPILFIHGTEDHFVPTQMVFRLYEACNSPKELVIIEGASHARNHYYESEQYERKVLDFMKKYSK